MRAAPRTAQGGGPPSHPHLGGQRDTPTCRPPPPPPPHPTSPDPQPSCAGRHCISGAGMRRPRSSRARPRPPPAPPSQPPSHRGPSHARAPPSHGALRGGHLLHERRGRNVQTSQPPVVKRADLHTHVGGRRVGVCTLTPWGVFAHSHLGVYLHTHNTHRGAFAHSPSTSPHTCALCTQG